MERTDMEYGKKPIAILFAEDDDDDALLTEKALREHHLLNAIYRVRDGEEVLAYLLHEGKYANTELFPKPALILLDLNMPKMNGAEVLAEIKKHPELRRIPVTVLTTSSSKEDILRLYDLGANSFITKPVDLKGFIDVVKNMSTYWFEIVQLPEA